MIIGIDVGGTHTDGICLQGENIAAENKTETRPDELVGSIIECLEAIHKEAPPRQIDRLVISSTLCTNAVLTGQTSPVGVFLFPGPGVQSDWEASLPNVAHPAGIQVPALANMALAEQGLENKIGANFEFNDLLNHVRDQLLQTASANGLKIQSPDELEVTESSVFNIINNHYRSHFFPRI